MDLQSKEQAMQGMALQAKTTAMRKGMIATKAKVGFVIDISGSMQSEFANGTVQEELERMFAIAKHFDDDGELDIFVFGTSAEYVGTVNDSNWYNAVQYHGMGGHITVLGKKYRLQNGTYYKLGLQAAYNFYFKPGWEHNTKKIGGVFGLGGTKYPVVSEVQDYPVFLVFSTDGDNMDKKETLNFVKNASAMPLFIQFAAFGRGPFNGLSQIDNMKGRYVDNAGMFEARDFRSCSDSQLYDGLLNEFPAWLKLTQGEGWYR